jgi:amidohydrolase
MIDELKSEVHSIEKMLVEWRRDFHRHPEVEFEERRTSQVIRKFLEDLELSVRPAGGTGLIAVLEGQPGERTVALRADMDALPLTEEGDKEYISQNPGAAHACGHDGHMAILMGAATTLRRRREKFSGRVVFLFQPAEEKPPGGARLMVEAGAMDDVDAVFGLHLWQPLPTGCVGIVKGPIMANSDSFSITVKGRGGHGSMPQATIDPILAASQLVVNAQSIVSRNVDPLKPCVVSFGMIRGGTTFNIIPGEMTLIGTVRSFHPEVQKLAETRLREITEETCRTFGAACTFKYEKGYPAVINHEDMADLVLRVARQTLGEEKIGPFEPVMGGEDFACYLQKVPGAFFFLGIGDGQPYPHHHPAFDIDERALPQGVMLMTAIALEFLAGGKPDATL